MAGRGPQHPHNSGASGGLGDARSQTGSDVLPTRERPVSSGSQLPVVHLPPWGRAGSSLDPGPHLSPSHSGVAGLAVAASGSYPNTLFGVP